MSALNTLQPYIPDLLLFQLSKVPGQPVCLHLPLKLTYRGYGANLTQSLIPELVKYLTSLVRIVWIIPIVYSNALLFLKISAYIIMRLDLDFVVSRILTQYSMADILYRKFYLRQGTRRMYAVAIYYH